MKHLFLISLFFPLLFGYSQNKILDNSNIQNLMAKGDSLNNKGKYLSAIKQYKKVLILSNSEIKLPEYIDLLYTIGHTYQKSRTSDSAKLYYEKAHALVKSTNSDSLFAIMHHYKSSYAFALNNNESALKHALKSLEFASKIKSKYLLHMANKDLGLAFLHEKNTVKARTYLNITLELANRLHDSTIIYNDIINLAQLDLMEKNYDEAKNKFIESTRYFERKDNFNGILVSKGFLSQLYLETGENEKAVKIGFEVLPLMNQLEFSGKTQKLVSNLAELAGEAKNPDSLASAKATSLIKKNDQINKTNNPKIQLAQKKAETKVISTILQQDSIQKPTIKDIEAFEALTKLQDSLYQNALNAKYHELEIKFNTTLKENENLQLKNKATEQELVIAKKSNRNLVLGITSIAGLSGLIALLFYARHRKKQLMWSNKIDIARAKQEEHNVIGNELHDNKAKQLEAIAIDLSKKGELEQAEKVNKVREEIRKLSHELTQVSFTDSEFDQQVITTAASYDTPEFSINLNGLNSIDWSKIDEAIKRNLFIVIREGISNAYNHSNANNLEINFGRKNNQLFATLNDDGKGFDNKSITKGKGLTNIEVRIKEINGKVSINSLKGKGTNISIIIALV